MKFNLYLKSAIGLVILMAISACQAFAEIKPQNIVGMWLFEEGRGQIAMDASEKGNNGEVFFGSTKWIKGKFGNAMQFDGNDWVQVPFNESLVLEELTIVAWVKVKTKNCWRGIMGRGHRPYNYALVITDRNEGRTNKLWFEIMGEPNWNGIVGGPDLGDEEWHHVAAVLGQDTG